MPALESLSLDTQLFGYPVGRIDLSDETFQSPCVLSDVETRGLMLDAYNGHRMKLLYLYAPVAQCPAKETRPSFPGQLVDVKTTLCMPMAQLWAQREALVRTAFLGEHARLAAVPKGDAPSDALRILAIESGTWSRFKIDTNIAKPGFEGMFTAWITNSINKSIADETFVALDKDTSEEIGFITLKKKGSTVSIGLLATSAQHRRKGVASMLLSRGALWAIEQSADPASLTYSVVTQGANEAALACYERFGFAKTTEQDLYHIWLPEHLDEPKRRADHGIIPFCKQYFTGKEVEYVGQVLSTGLDSSSRFTNMCALRLKELLGEGCDRTIIVPSGTAALEMAALLAQLGDGDEVIMPSYTFSSSANAFVLRGCVPVFVDCRLDTLNIDETLIEAAVTARTKAICAVHYAGCPCEMDAIMAIAARHGLFVVEDAAQGFMSTYKGRPLGSIGHFGCFSFHYTKNVICGEGGAISINRNADFARRSMVLWEKGTNRHDFMLGKIDKYEWVDMGSSYVPNEVSCAILWAQLERCQDITTSRLANYQMYERGLADLRASGTLRYASIPQDCKHNAHIFFIILRSADERVFYEAELKKRGINAFSHYVPLHSAPAGRRFGRASGELPNTQLVAAGLLRLPLWLGLKREEIEYVIESMHIVAGACARQSLAAM